MNLTELVAMAGVVVLLLLAVCAGTELDSRRQRRERQRLADERRWRNAPVRGPLCERCPYRDTPR